MIKAQPGALEFMGIALPARAWWAFPPEKLPINQQVNEATDQRAGNNLGGRGWGTGSRGSAEGESGRPEL